MSMQLQAQVKPASSSTSGFTPVQTVFMQRKCTSGNHTMAGGERAECSKKKRFGLQTKLMVNKPGDIYEREADRIADQMMAAPAHPGVSGAPPCIQRFSGRSNRQMDAAPGSIDHALVSPGRPLDPALQQDMEQRFGHDFSRVRVHTGAAAEQSAREVNANAYTVGHDLFFGAGRFVPGTFEGRRLIAHELTHVVQQSGADGVRGSQSNENRGLSTIRVPLLMSGHGVQVARQVAGTPPAPSTSPAPATSPTMRTVKVWLNAFIPKDISGLTRAAPGHPGETMIPGPSDWFSDCFMTDQRDFDSNIHASSRMHSEIEIDIGGPSENFQWHNCDPTREIDCEDGDEECRKKGNTSRMKYSNLRGSVLSLIKIDLNAAANNPCFGGSPDIDYLGTVTIDAAVRKVKFGGLIDAFPAFEMYATADGGAGKPLFKEPPPAGNTPSDLFGGANRGIAVEATI